MNDLFLIASGAGLQDGLNPCIFMACAVFMAYGLALKRVFFRTPWLSFIFGFAYALGMLIFNFSPYQIYILQSNFIIAAKFLYFVLSVGAFILGVLFLKDWFLLGRKLPGEDPSSDKINFFSPGSVLVCLTAGILGMVLSALATIWPIDKYIVILGNTAIIKGQWQTVIWLLIDYVLISMWSLWLLWAFLSINNLRPSLLKIAYAFVFFVASSCVILMFK